MYPTEELAAQDRWGYTPSDSQWNYVSESFAAEFDTEDDVPDDVKAEFDEEWSA